MNLIREDRITIQTLSPITVYQSDPDGRTLFFSPEDPRFARGVEQNARRKWQSYHGSAEPPAFSFRVPAGEPFRKTVTTYQGVYITGWNGRFELEGSPMMLDFLQSDRAWREERAGLRDVPDGRVKYQYGKMEKHIRYRGSGVCGVAAIGKRNPMPSAGCRRHGVNSLYR